MSFMPQGGKCFMNGPINTLIDKNKFILNNLIRLSVQIRLLIYPKKKNVLATNLSCFTLF